MQQVVIIGAGPTGLTTALKLKRKGHPVLVLEKRSLHISTRSAFARFNHLALNYLVVDQLNEIDAMKHISSSYQLIDLFRNIDDYHQTEFKINGVHDPEIINSKRKEIGAELTAKHVLQGIPFG